MVKYALNIIMLYSAARLKYKKWKQNMQAFVVNIMWKKSCCHYLELLSY